MVVKILGWSGNPQEPRLVYSTQFCMIKIANLPSITPKEVQS